MLPIPKPIIDIIQFPDPASIPRPTFMIRPVMFKYLMGCRSWHLEPQFRDQSSKKASKSSFWSINTKQFAQKLSFYCPLEKRCLIRASRLKKTLNLQLLELNPLNCWHRIRFFRSYANMLIVIWKGALREFKGKAFRWYPQPGYKQTIFLIFNRKVLVFGQNGFDF